MLKKIYRVTKKKEFDLIFSQGKSRQTEELGVKLLVNDLTFNRFGVIISNKVSKSAVVRNSIKRKIRANFDHLLPNLKKSYDIVVITRPSVIKLSSQEIKDKLTFLFKGLKIYHE